MVNTRPSSAAPVPAGKRPPPSAASIRGMKRPPPSAASIGGKKRPKVRSFPTSLPLHAADPPTGAIASSPERISTTPRGRGTAETELPRNLRAQSSQVAGQLRRSYRGISARRAHRMECNSSASEVSKDAQLVPPIKKPYSIQVDYNGTIGGKDAAKFRSRCGVLIRSLVPISYKDWRLVADVYLISFWKALLQDFDMNVKPENVPEILSENLSQYYRTHKYHIRSKFIRTAASKQAAIAGRPDGIDEVEWEMFVDNEWDEKKREQCLKNAANRGKNPITHGLGRKTYSDAYRQIKKGGGNPTRAAVWKAGHIGKDGNVLPSAQEKFNELVAAETRRKATPAHEYNSEMDFNDIEHDELVEDFGPDKKSRCRAISYNSSLKKVKFGQAVKEITKHENSLMSEEFQLRMEATVKATVQATVKDTVETTLRATVESVVKECMKEFGMLLGTQLPRKEGPLNTVVEAPRTKGASNTDGNAPGTEGNSISDRDKICSKNLAINMDGVSNRTPTKGRQYVMLLSRDVKKVAKGYIAPRNICHKRKVARDERVVWVTEVMDPEAHIYEAPQDGNYKLCDIADGGFLIWLEGRLEYL